MSASPRASARPGSTSIRRPMPPPRCGPPSARPTRWSSTSLPDADGRDLSRALRRAASTPPRFSSSRGTPRRIRSPPSARTSTTTWRDLRAPRGRRALRALIRGSRTAAPLRVRHGPARSHDARRERRGRSGLADADRVPRAVGAGRRPGGIIRIRNWSAPADRRARSSTTTRSTSTSPPARQAAQGRGWDGDRDDSRRRLRLQSQTSATGTAGPRRRRRRHDDDDVDVAEGVVPVSWLEPTPTRAAANPEHQMAEPGEHPRPCTAERALERAGGYQMNDRTTASGGRGRPGAPSR